VAQCVAYVGVKLCKNLMSILTETDTELLVYTMTLINKVSHSSLVHTFSCFALCLALLIGTSKKGKGSPYSITERRVPELIPVLGIQPAGGMSHKPVGRLPLHSARPAVTPATLKRAATSFAVW